MLAQRISSLLGCTLPTRKMVNDIWTQTQLKMEPMPITYNNSNPPVTVPWFNVYNSNIWAQRQTYLPSFPLGDSVAGDKKDVIISTYIYNWRVKRSGEISSGRTAFFFDQAEG
jgi:hypothetical protein